MVYQQIDLCHQNGRKWRVQDMEGVSKQALGHGEREPTRLVNAKEEQVQEEQAQGKLHQDVFHRLFRGRAQDEFRKAVETVKENVQCWEASASQISQAASACNFNMGSPPNVLAPNEEACFSRPV